MEEEVRSELATEVVRLGGWGVGGGGVSNLLCSFLLRPYLYQCGIDMVFCRFWLFLKELLQRNTYLTHIIA